MTIKLLCAACFVIEVIAVLMVIFSFALLFSTSSLEEFFSILTNLGVYLLVAAYFIEKHVKLDILAEAEKEKNKAEKSGG